MKCLGQVCSLVYYEKWRTAQQLQAVCKIEVEEHRWKILGHVQDLVVSNLQYGTPMPDGGFLG